MSDPAPLPSDTNPDAWAQALLQRQAVMLEALAESGLRMAQAIEARVSGAADDASVQPADAAMAFSRVARAVRMTALLQTKLISDIGRLRASAARAADEAREAAEAQDDLAAWRADPAYGRKAKVEAIVARVARAEGDDPERIERLVCEAGERLDDEDIWGDVLERPVGELVARICRDLGLAPDWARLGQEAWAEAEADDPRSPFARFNATRPPPLAGEGDPKGGGGIPPPPLWKSAAARNSA